MSGRSQLDEQLKTMREQFVGMQDALIAQLKSLTENTSGEPQAALCAHLESLDREIDRAEQAIEHDALKMLALQAPVARDLRLVLLIVQSLPDLERAGDYARHLAREAGRSTPAHQETLATLMRMAQTLRAATWPVNAQDALQVVEMDTTVDDLYEQALRSQLQGEGQPVAEALLAAQWWRSAERLGDHLKNVAVRLTRLNA